jgi:ribonuclease VapC
MVIDTSALIAILLAEPESGRLVDAIVADEVRLVPATTAVEAACVMLARRGPSGEIALDALLQRLGIEVVPLSPAAAAHARSAYGRYGREVGNPAVLNFGDCLAYGAAMALGEPLLFRGEDFGLTDVPRVTY